MYLYHPNSGACSRPCLQLVFQNLLDLHTSHKTSKNITLFNHQLGVRCSMSMSWFYYSFTTTYLFGFVWKCWETPFHPSVNHHFPYSKYHNATGGIHPPFSEPDLSPFHQASSGKFRLSMEPRKRCRCRVSWPNHWRWKEVFIYPTYSCVYVIDGLDMVRCIYMLCVCIYIYK